MNFILFWTTKFRLFFAVCKTRAVKRTLQSAISISQNASASVKEYFDRLLKVSIECEKLAVEHKRLCSLKSDKPLLKVCLSLGVVETSSKSEVKLTKLDIETALTRHKYGDWGELSVAEWSRNNRIAQSGSGIIRSFYKSKGKDTICINTCMPSGDTLLHLEDE